jgi:hypothetical protein
MSDISIRYVYVNNRVTLVTHPVISHNWGKQLDDDDYNPNISEVFCDTYIRSPYFLYENVFTYIKSSSGEINQLKN